MSVRVSVVVPTYKRPKLLKRCLKALSEQRFDASAYEIIVVDDAGSQETRRLVESFSGKPAIRYLSSDHTSGPAAARNAGWRAAQGEIIAFTDDDCIPSPNWLREGLNAFDPQVAGVSGRLHVPLPANPSDYQKNASHLSLSEFVTANCFYRRFALEEVGGFDEHFGTAWREDTDLYFRLLKRSYQFEDAHSAVVTHPVRPERWGISLKQQRKSMYNALLYKKHPDLYREQVQKSPPLKYYVIVCSGIIALAAMVFRNIFLAVLMFSAWLGMTSHFAMQRLRGTSKEPAHIAEIAFTSVLIPPLSVFWRLYGAFKFRTFFF